MDISNYVDSILFLVISSAISIAVKYVIGFIKDHKIDEFVTKAVKEAEILYIDPKSGDKKFDYVAKKLVEFAAKIGIKLTQDRVKMLIEAAVVDLKSTIGDALKK